MFWGGREKSLGKYRRGHSRRGCKGTACAGLGVQGGAVGRLRGGKQRGNTGEDGASLKAKPCHLDTNENIQKILLAVTWIVETTLRRDH